MKRKLITLIIFICFSSCELKASTGISESTRHKTFDKKAHPRPKTTSTSTEPPEQVPENRTIIVKIPFTKEQPKPPPPPRKHDPEMPYELVQTWASDISTEIIKVEKSVVREGVISEKFKDIEMEERNGAAVVDNIAAALEDLLERRARAAENIGREAERLATAAGKSSPPSDYVFKKSQGLAKLKQNATTDDFWEIPNNCSEKRPIPVEKLSHFGKGARVQLDTSSVQVPAEVFDCDYRVLPHVYWSEGLLHTFKQNYAQDAMTDFQYFCSAKGFLRHYPAAVWNSMFTLKLTDDESDEDDGPADVYDCRLRPWYVAAEGAPRDIIILFDFSGSMVNSSNKVHAEQFALTLLTTLTDDDHVNVLSFNNYHTESVINCFDDILVPANHINTAAMMTMLKVHVIKNETDITKALEVAVDLLNKTHTARESPYKPKACQQAIVLLSDSINDNYTLNMTILDPTNRIRLFVIWLHDVQGLRDYSYQYSQQLACTIDGYFSELVTDFDVTEQVMQILRVLERPLVHQRKERLRAFSDVYAHVEDPRRSDYYWRMKENEEQAYQYRELRRNKKRFLSDSQLYSAYVRQTSLNTHGYYYEGTGRDYKLQITVSVPVFDDTRTENITIQLAEEKQRNSTRTYPTNRLLGVAGVDIPIKHLKLMLPYYQLGAGGSLFIIDHRGNIILHDNLKPVFDGDILRPGYRTVDLLDLEQSAYVLKPRQYYSDWLEFREAVVKQPRGKRVLSAKYIFDSELRAILGEREYHWKRVKEHYTVVASLPTYNRRHAVPKGAFTQQLANSSYKALTEMAVHPDWLYCKHVDQQFNESDCEVRHFVMRRKDEPDFKMQNLRHIFSPFPTSLLEKTYMCNEELMARLCKEAMATKQWADEYQNETAHRDCVSCELGSVTAFFAGESGLTRWQQYRMTSGKAEPPSGDQWPGGPTESWYKRAVAAPGTLVIHAPLTPMRKMRNTDRMPPAFTVRDKWLTAARTMTAKHDKGYKGMIGVAGFHFYPDHLEDLLRITTNRPCPESVKVCEPRCDGENWACLLIDEGGWIVAGETRDEDDITAEDPIRFHLANAFPHAMRALLSAKIFELNWIHDYQGICFPPEKETVKAASPISSSMMKTIWRSISMLLHVTREMMTVIALVTTGSLVTGDTEFEKQKRRNATKKSYERVKFENLHDDRVIINRTRFAACDRSRALYVLQPQHLPRLRTAAKDCSWPVVGAEVPETNLILLAINRLCPDKGRPVNDPFVNVPVDINVDVSDWEYMTSSANLACWRNKVHLPIRAPPTACFPHVYEDEEGYRQCGPWLPNPEPSGARRLTAQPMISILVLSFIFTHFLLCCERTYNGPTLTLYKGCKGTHDDLYLQSGPLVKL